MDFKTLCIHGSKDRRDDTGAISFPIFQSATFAHPGVGQSTGYDYSRDRNPTRDHLEKTLAALEGAHDALAFATGMAAIAVLMELFKPGDHHIASDDLYGGTYRYFRQICEKNGQKFTFVNTSNLAEIEAAITPATKAVFIETPTNPMMQVTDIAAVASLTKKHGLLLVVDNTFLTPYCQRPLELGADIVMHSGTKYLGGHNDTLAGFLTVKDPAIAERLRFLFKTSGPSLAPFDCWLVIRGLKTLAVRMDRQQENAAKIAEWLSTRKKVTKVYYPGLPAHPDYEISRKQASGFGAMLSLRTDSEETAVRILQRVSLIQYAESLGGVETLITYPMLQTHVDVPQEVREAKGVDERLLRLSVGCEHAQDLINDLKQAMED